MWAQLVKGRIKDGDFEKLQELGQQWEEQVGRGTDSGWMRSLYLRNANDPNELYELVYFESEDKARANERTPRHLEMVSQLGALFEGQPEFVDLIPLEETTR